MYLSSRCVLADGLAVSLCYFALFVWMLAFMWRVGSTVVVYTDTVGESARRGFETFQIDPILHLLVVQSPVDCV